MKILIVDYICTRGHNFFNRIHINALYRLGFNLVFVARKGYLDVSENSEYFDIPEKYYIPQKTRNLNPLTYTYYDIKKLQFVRSIMDSQKPDAIVFLTYEVLSLVFFRVKAPTFLVNHVNVDFLCFWYRDLATRLLPKNFIHVCLSKRIGEYVNYKYLGYKTIFIPHGFIQTPFTSKFREKIIFCPITSSLNKSLFNEIITDKRVISYLDENGTRMVVKTNESFDDVPNCISILNGYIDKELYSKYVHDSIAIFLPYDKSFNYRVSGIFHEAFSYNIPIMTSIIPAFDEYKKHILYDFQIGSANEFVSTIKKIMTMDSYYVKLEELDPAPFWQKSLITILR